MATEQAQSLGRNIRRRRLAAGLSQGKLARAIGVDKSTISHWEVGDYSPNLFMVHRLALLFGCSIEDLLGAAPCMP